MLTFRQERMEILTVLLGAGRAWLRGGRAACALEWRLPGAPTSSE